MCYYIVLIFRDQIEKAWSTDLKGLIFDKRRGLKQILTFFFFVSALVYSLKCLLSISYSH